MWSTSTNVYLKVGQKRFEKEMNIKKYPNVPSVKLDGFSFDKTLISNPLI